ncbi:MAG: hypothetical protein AAFV01_04240 [Bacteroidota bacterium]
MSYPATPFQPRPHAPVCQACGKRIIWVTTEKNLKQMPVDADWEYGDGHRTLMVPTEAGLWRAVAKAPDNTLGREPHFGTCPNREALRPRRPRTTPLRLVR